MFARRLFSVALTLFAVTVASLVAETAEAQFRRFGPRVMVRGPGVGVTVGRGGVGVSVVSPYAVPHRTFRGGPMFMPPRPAFMPPAPFFSPRAAFARPVPSPRSAAPREPAPAANVPSTNGPSLASPSASGPTLANPQTGLTEAPRFEPTEANPQAKATPPVAVASPSAPASSSLPLPSEAELANLNAEAFAAAMLDISATLDARLATLPGGDGWQKYLALPKSMTDDPAKLAKLLSRYDSVARDRQFASIASLPEFAVLRTALRIAIDRDMAAAPALDGSSSDAASEAIESLPAPQSQSEPRSQSDGVERSILKRS